MARRFKVGDRIRLKPSEELSLTEYTWGTVVVDDDDCLANVKYPYRVKITGVTFEITDDLIWDKDGNGYSSWIARNEYVDTQFTSNKFK